MASEGAELPAAALKAIQRGVPADKVLMPHVELSPRERQFVQRMAEGAGKREAFIEAFEPGGTSRSVSTAAWKVAKRPEVQQALAQEKAVQRLRYSQNPLDIRNFVVDSLQHEARTAQKPGDRLRALELLGKLADVAAFETRSVITHERAGDTTARLREKLARLGAIEVEARQVAEEGGDTPTVPPPPQTGRASGGPTRSTNPHERSEENTLTPNLHDRSGDPDGHLTPNLQEDLTPNLQGCPYEEEITPPRGGVFEEEAPHEESLGSHSGGKKKKERPIWEDPKRWYAETMGEVPKIEWQPREEARDEVQKRLRYDEGGG
jgi:hypothetical protein